jgi:hypothetical protein
MARPAFVVTFDDAALAEDLAHASAPGRVVALDARRQFAAHGIEVGVLRPCRDEGRDGTRLSGCVKTYLHCLAFGRRHPLRTGQSSVYELAAGRLKRP